MARRNKRGTLSSKVPTDELYEALNQAVREMKAFNRRVVSVELLLSAFIKLPDSEAHQILRKSANQRGFNWADFERNVEQEARRALDIDVDFDFVNDANQRIPLGDRVLYVIDKGLGLAESRNETRCSSAHVLSFMCQEQVSTSRLLSRVGITRHAVESLLIAPRASKYAAAHDYVVLAQEGQLAPLYERTILLRDFTSLLSIQHNRNIILIGPTGVGKQSLVYTLAACIAQNQGPLGIKSVIEMSEKALLDDAYRTVQTGLRLAKGGILFVPNIARFFGGFRAEFSERAGLELMKAFYDEDIVIVGTVTSGRFDDRLAQNDIITQNSQLLRVPPTTQDDTVHILTTLKPKFESDYNLTIDDNSLANIARLAGRYLTDEPLPGAAVHLLHRTCVQVNLTYNTTATNQPQADKRVDVEDVMVATSLLTGIPVSNMGADERDRYANMVEHLHKRIIGQEEAVLALSQAVRMARVGLKDPKRPIGSFLFLGPTGVGKSELAKALAEFMFGTEDALIVLDMSEYMNESAVNRLIGSPPGYVGHEAGGQLTDAVKEQPYSVILFDEVEKAAIKVFDVLLQILDEGRLTSGEGETVRFSECVILMTSNIGSPYLANPELSEADARELTEEELKTHFRPEFLNRLDDIIFFHLLNDDHLSKIMDLLLRKENKLLANRQLSLTISDAAKTWILAKNEHPEWGARPLRRLISRYVRTPLANFLLEKNPQAGVAIHLDVKNDALDFDFT